VISALTTSSTYDLSCSTANGNATASTTVSVDTVTVTRIDSVTGSTPQLATFGSWDQHVVSNSNGIFVAYDYGDNSHNPDHWRLARSTDNGKSFQIIYDAGQDAAVASAPALETDQAGNVYAIAPTNQTNSWTTEPTLFYRFDAVDDYSKPTVVPLAIGSSTKFSTVYDRTRNLIDVLFWDFGVKNQPNFFSITTSGTVVNDVDLFTASNPHAIPEYPDLTIAPDGTVFAGWSTMDAELWDDGAGTQNYYDAHFVASPDGGTTWVGENGTLTIPIAGDDTGPAFTIEDESNPSEFLPWGSSGYDGNWNLLQGFAYNNGNLDFFYGGPKPSAHNAYARMEWQTRTIDKRISPYFGADGIEFDTAGGAFAQSASADGRLYFVGGYYHQGIQRLGIVYSDDAGTTWHQGARSDEWSGTCEYINTASALTADGLVIGRFTAQTGGQTSVYFFSSSAL